MLRSSRLRSLRKVSNFVSKLSNSSNIYSSQRCMHFLRKNRSIIAPSHNNINTAHNQKFQQFPSCNLFVHSRHRFSNLPDHEVVGLPALSPSVETSKIVEWKKKEGDFVEANEAIAVVQTDKAELDWQVTDDVYLAKILLEPGETVPVGTDCCIFVDNESDVAPFANYSGSGSGASSSGGGAAEAPAQETQPSAPAPSGGGGGGGGSSLPANLPEFTVEGLPALSPTATDGAIVEWLVQEGDMVEEGSGIAEIQTDKSAVTWTATDEAYVAKLLYPVSTDVRLPVGTPLAVFVESKDDVAAFAGIDASAFLGGGSGGGSQPAEAAPAAPAAEPAQESEGSGPRGRIIASDVEKASKTQKAAPAGKAAKPASGAAPVSFDIASSDRSFEDIPMTMMREVIAKRLSESKFTSPHYYVTFEFELDNLLRMRADMNEGEESKVSINDFIVKACALALKQVPMANVSWHDSYIRRYNYVDISVAVATPTGLITPIVKDADLKGLRAISSEVKDLAKRAKDNKLLPHEFQGGTFTISNLGMFGVKNFTAIINPPQSSILAVGGGIQVLKPDPNSERGFRTATTMTATISSDHRSIDGALAAQYMGALKQYIEHPAKMLL